MITCYLDSQDYSSLTDPKQDNFERRQIKEALLHLARSKQVRFTFSAISVCESVSLTAEATHLAELKAELLSELCGSNALVSFDRLIRAELTALGQRGLAPTDMLDLTGRWFPEIPIDETPAPPWEMMQEIAQEELKTMGFSRHERRAKARSLVKNGKPRPLLTSLLAQQDPNACITEFLKKYPMRPEYAEIMARYARGQGTKKDFNEALMNSLSDPLWMMKWFTTQHALSSPIADIVRKPGRELGQAMRSLSESSVQLAKTLREGGFDTNPTGKNGEIKLRWQEAVKLQLVSVAQRIANHMCIDLGNYDANDVVMHCRGLTTGIRSMFSSVWANVGEGRREVISDSQPVDALHALYAPYVQVFRADKFMTPHIQKQVTNAGTIVVPRLSELVGVLEKRLR